METPSTRVEVGIPDDRRLEALDRLLDRQLAWVAAANERITTPLTLATAMLGVSAALAPSKASEWTLLQGVLAGFSTLGLLTCLGCCSFAVFPRTAAPHDSLVYFGGVASWERAKFVTEALRRSVTEHAQDLAQQVHVNATIAQTKFLWVQRALFVLIVSVPAWLGALCLLYQGR